MTEDPRTQFSSFIDTVLNTHNLNLFFQDILEERRLQLVPLFQFDLKDYVEIVPPEKEDDLMKYLNRAIKQFRNEYKSTHGYGPLEDEIKAHLPQMFQDFQNGIPINEIALPPIDLPPLPALVPRNRNNREQGINLFIGLCKESRNIISSVDMYSSYFRWCGENGYGTCSSPTLTKYFRDSDKRATESLNEKGRSQGWYLTPP
jgi:hypothetical protein